MFLLSPITRRRRGPDVAALLSVPSLAHVDARRLAALAPQADRLRLPPGRTVAQAGMTARELVVVVAGEAAVVHPDGSRTVLGPGTEIGGPELLAGRRHAATVVALSDLDVVVVNGPAVRGAHAEGIARIAPPVTVLPSPSPSSSPSSSRAGVRHVRLAN